MSRIFIIIDLKKLTQATEVIEISIIYTTSHVQKFQ